jgi:two-component system, chemotaxis family, chemotaxis protein CheY
MPTEDRTKICLVADDSEVVRKVARRIFENLDFEIEEAASGQEALDSCQKAMPDVILYDAHMPPMANVEFLTTLRGMPHGSKPLVIFCATDNDPGEIARALTAGADEYVLKPFDREAIKAKLATTDLLVKDAG